MLGYVTSSGWIFDPRNTERGITIHVSHLNGANHSLLFDGLNAAVHAKIFLACSTWEFSRRSLTDILKEADELFEKLTFESAYIGVEIILRDVRILCRDTDQKQVELEIGGMGSPECRMSYQDPYDAYMTLYGILRMLKSGYLKHGYPAPQR